MIGFFYYSNIKNNVLPGTDTFIPEETVLNLDVHLTGVMY